MLCSSNVVAQLVRSLAKLWEEQFSGKRVDVKVKMILLNNCVGLSSTRSRTPLNVFGSVERSVDTAAEGWSAFHLNNPSSKYAFLSTGS